MDATGGSIWLNLSLLFESLIICLFLLLNAIFLLYESFLSSSHIHPAYYISSFCVL